MADQNDRGSTSDPMGQSFDPRTWTSAAPSSSTASEKAGPTGKARAKEAPSPSRKPGPGKVLLLGGAALVVVLAAVAGLAFTHKTAPVAPSADTAAETMHSSFVLARLDDATQAMVAAGVAPDEAKAATAEVAARLGAGPGDLRVAYAVQRRGTQASLVSLEVRRPDGTGAAATRDAAGALSTRTIASDAKAQIKVVRGEIDSQSFYSSAVSAGVVDTLIPEFIQAFTFDFDLQREVASGDVFEAAFEQTRDGAGAAIGAPRLLFASLETKAKSRALYLFTPPGETKSGWFDGNGSSITRSLMRTPVDGARITSTFGMRFHPVLAFTRMHQGVDFATPIGSPVLASGDGVVEFAGPHAGHGNYLKIRHSPTLETAYAHLSAFEAPVGTMVRQGQEVAKSGNTGVSTGPHVHYEVLVGGQFVDPQTFQTESGRALSGAALKAFKAERDRIDGLRASQNG